MVAFYLLFIFPGIQKNGKAIINTPSNLALTGFSNITLDKLTYQIGNITKISDPGDNSHTGEFNESKIALVKPTFIDAAYDNSFYIFYKKYAHIPPNTNVTTYLNLLNSDITNNPSGSIGNVYYMISLRKNLKWMSNSTQITELTDQDVHKGAIFSQSGDNQYDVLVLGHQQHVTQKRI